MPNRTYAPRNPPNVTDRVLHHPFEVFLSAWWVVCGLVLALSLAWPRLPTSPSLGDLPAPAMLAVSLLLGVGGAATLLGLMPSWERLDVGWLVERIGLLMSGFGWAVYGLTAFLVVPGSLVAWSLGGAMSGAAALRLAASFAIERRTRAAVAGRGRAEGVA